LALVASWVNAAKTHALEVSKNYSSRAHPAHARGEEKRELSAMMSKRPGIKMADTHRRIASVVAASQKDEEDAEMQATAETVPLRCALARQRTATSANRPASVQLTSVLLLHQWHQPALSDAA